MLSFRINLKFKVQRNQNKKVIKKTGGKIHEGAFFIDGFSNLCECRCEYGIRHKL